MKLEEAARKGTVIVNLIGDAGQVDTWKDIRPHLTKGKAHYVSHGMPIHFSDATGIVVPDGVDSIMNAPKGAGSTVRKNFKAGSGINTSIAVMNDATGRATDLVKAIGIAAGAGYMFETTAAREVVSDHVGERAILLSAAGALAEQSFYSLVRSGMDPKQAYIKSAEQLTQVIVPTIGKGGIHAIYEQARKANKLDVVKAYQDAALKAADPTFKILYQKVAEGKEAATSLRENAGPNYRQQLDSELAALDGAEIWTKGAEIRKAGGDRDYNGQITNWELAGSVIGFGTSQFNLLTRNGHSPSEAFNENMGRVLTKSKSNLYG